LHSASKELADHLKKKNYKAPGLLHDGRKSHLSLSAFVELISQLDVPNESFIIKKNEKAITVSSCHVLFSK
jgi:hypothetical protein